MAFGQELKDFVSGFKTGREIVTDAEDRKWKQKKYDEEAARHDRERGEDVGWRTSQADRAQANVDRSFNASQEAAGRAEAWRQQDYGIRKNESDARADYYRGRGASYGNDGSVLPDPIDPYGTNVNSGEGSTVPPSTPDDNSDTSDTSNDQSFNTSSPRIYGNGTQVASNDPSFMPDQALDTSLTANGKNNWLQYANQSAVRNEPVSPRLQTAMSKVAPAMGLTVKVFSGGQESNRPGQGTGSTRHNHGDAADVFLYKDGRKLDWANPQDRPIFEEFVHRSKQAGMTGFGAGQGYMQPGSMHVGYGTPGVWGAGGRGANAAPWLRQAANFSTGGSVSAIPDEIAHSSPRPQEAQQEPQGDPMSGLLTLSLDDPGPPVETAQANSPVATDAGPEQSAIPEGDVPTPMPRPDYEGVQNNEKPTKKDVPKDPFEAGKMAVLQGLKEAGYEAGGAHDETAIDDPKQAEAHSNYLRGKGAAPSQVMGAVLKKVDPEGKMNPGERNMLALGTVYRYYMQNGEQKKANQAAMSMVQYWRQQSQQYLALGQAAAENGDLPAATKAAAMAYTMIPNGRDLKIDHNDDGTLTVHVTDAKSGKQITKKVMNPEDFIRGAMQLGPGDFDNEILNAAGAPTEKFTNMSMGDRKALDETIEPLLTAEAEKTPDASPAGITAFNSLAKSIAGTKENNIDAGQAIDITRSLMSGTEKTKSNPEGNYTVKPVRNHPERSRVTVDGQTVVVDNNVLAGLTKARGLKAKQDKADAAQKAKDAKEGVFGTDNQELWNKATSQFQTRRDEMQSGGNPTEQKTSNMQDAGAAIGGMMTPQANPQTGVPEGPVAPSPSPASAQAGNEVPGQPQAIPDDTRQIVESLMAQRRQIEPLAKRGDPKAVAMLQRIDQRLKSLVPQ